MKKTALLITLLGAGLLSSSLSFACPKKDGVDTIKPTAAQQEECKTHVNKAGKDECKTQDCDHKKKGECDSKTHNEEECKTKHGQTSKEPAHMAGDAHKTGAHMMGMGGYDLNMMMRSPKIERVRALALSEEQEKQVNALADELRDKNWNTMGEIHKQGSKLRDLYAADVRDADAIDAVYKDIFDAQRKIIVEIVRAENKVYQVLTPEQKKLMSGGMAMMKPMH